MHDKGDANEEHFTPSNTFKADTYLVIIESLLAEVQNWVKAHDDIFKTFGFLSELTTLSIEQFEDKAQESRIQMTWKIHWWLS